MSAVYLLHFDRPLQHARHYLGFTAEEDVQTRIDTHLKGQGSPLVRAALQAGIGVHTAHVFHGADEVFERRIKNHNGFGKWCPLCGIKSRPIPTFEPWRPLTPKMKRLGRGGINKYGVRA